MNGTVPATPHRLRSATSGLRNVHCAASLPPTEQLLVGGGDTRIALVPGREVNRYGCGVRPDPTLAAFGSSTASVISEAAYAAADTLRTTLAAELRHASPDAVYARETGRVRRELLQLCGLEGPAAPEVMLAPSGTDLHAVAGQWLADARTLIIMVDPCETGRGVAAAMATGTGAATVATIRLRDADGVPRPAAAVDTEVEDLATAAIATGRRVLVVMVDVSKTGLVAPSPACVAALHGRLPQAVQVLVDGCQFRLAPATLRAYLDRGFLVALTGSKFITGPSFAGALLVPRDAARRLAAQLPAADHPLRLVRGDLPPHWNAAEHLPAATNFGLLLRWEAALTQLHAFRALPDAAVREFLARFADAVRTRLDTDPVFMPVPVGPLERGLLAGGTGWDHIQTIFPFLLCRPSHGGHRRPLSHTESAAVFRLLSHSARSDTGVDVQSSLRCQLGQPVGCGTRDGVAVSALRLCASARLVVEGAADGGRQGAAVIARAMTALDKAARIAAGRIA
ncbi:MAG: hypothetical protein B7Z66_11125 [Chromatiales bacterium 21-64-14]|nr:MAG: hypothetical protein B7Z66_11125 [Chromatiales bacterium 21-64-14]HQU16779.1 hypothetical protein [Gammaproteobacteria bacterium]